MSQQFPPNQPSFQQPQKPGGPGGGYPPPQKSSGKNTWMIIAIVMGVVAVMSICVCGILGALLLPAVQAAREAARMSVSANNMKQIGMGLHNYHDTFTQFPPAFTVDEAGARRHSWRTAILPFAEQVRVYEQVDFNQPWDQPPNAGLQSTAMPHLMSPGDTEAPPTDTSYVVICDPEAAFSPEGAFRLRDMLDGSSNTIAVIEVRNSGIGWMEPRDLNIDEAIQAIQTANRPAVNALMVDGSVRAIPTNIETGKLRALMTRKGGEQVMDF